MYTLPHIQTLGKGNKLQYITIEDAILYFSYHDLVAFGYKDILVVRENIWGNTTGKHLNSIDDGKKENRVSAETFYELYQEYIGKRLQSRYNE